MHKAFLLVAHHTLFALNSNLPTLSFFLFSKAKVHTVLYAKVEKRRKCMEDKKKLALYKDQFGFQCAYKDICLPLPLYSACLFTCRNKPKASCRKCISLAVFFFFWYGQKRNFWQKSLLVFSVVWVRAKAQNVLSNALARMEGAPRSCSFKIPIFPKGSLAITLNNHAHTYTQIILIYTGFHRKRGNLSNAPSSLSPFSRSRTHHTHIHTNSSILHASHAKSSTVPTPNR